MRNQPSRGGAGQTLREAILEGEEAQGFPDAAQGDEKGALVGGGIEKAVQAVLQEVQTVQEGLLPGLVGPVLLEGKLALKVPGVAAEGRGGEAVAGGQGAEARPIDEAAVDVGAGGVVANGTTFVHGFSVFSLRFSVKEPGERLSGREVMGQHGWDSWREIMQLERSGCVHTPFLLTNNFNVHTIYLWKLNGTRLRREKT